MAQPSKYQSTWSNNVKCYNWRKCISSLITDREIFKGDARIKEWKRSQ